MPETPEEEKQNESTIPETATPAEFKREENPLKLSVKKIDEELCKLWSLSPQSAENCIKQFRDELLRYIGHSESLDSAAKLNWDASWLTPWKWHFSPKLYLRSLPVSHLKRQVANNTLEVIAKIEDAFTLYTETFAHNGITIESSPASIIARDENAFLKLANVMTELSTLENKANHSSWFLWNWRPQGQLATIVRLFHEKVDEMLLETQSRIEKAAQQMKHDMHPTYSPRVKKLSVT